MNPKDINEPIMSEGHRNLNLNNIIMIGYSQKLDDLIKIHPNELFSNHIPIDDDDLVQGGLFYRDSNYLDAIKSYTKLVERISKVEAPIPRDAIQSLGIALSNNASCKLIMNDHRSVTEDLEKSVSINLIFINNSLEYQRLTITQILQLYKSYINLFDLKQAQQLWLSVQQDCNLLILIYQNPKFKLDFENLTKILNWLIFMEKKIMEFKTQMDWDLVHQYFKILENQIKIWNLNDSIEELFPLELERIKAESLAWLGYPEEAEVIANQCMDPVYFDATHDLWLRGLISFAYGNLQESLNRFERLEEIKPDSISTGTMNRLKHLMFQHDEVKKFSIDQNLDSFPKMTEVIQKVLCRIGQYPIEQAFEDNIRLIYIYTCFNNLHKMTNALEIEKCIQEVIKYTNEILSSEILVNNMNTKAPMIPIRYKKLLLIAFLYKSRVWAHNDHNLFKSIESYSCLIHYFRFLNGYNLVPDLNMPLINEELNRVKMRCDYLNQYHQHQHQTRLNVAANQSLMHQASISKEKAFEEALRLSKLKYGYYQVLGVKKTACQRDIRSAFRKSALETHPDRGGSTKHFQLLNEIHLTLTDRIKRHAYDNYQKRLNE